MGAVTKRDTREWYLDLAKLMAMLLVAYGHLAVVGSLGTTIESAINGTLPVPLLADISGPLVKFSNLFYIPFGIETAVVGVVVFFLISGYFIPGLQERENAPGTPLLLWKRMYKLLPTVIVCVLANGILAYVAEGIRFPIKTYIKTAILANAFLGGESTMGVLWYLYVLVFVYFVSTLIPRFTLQNLTWVFFLLYAIVILPRVAPELGMAAHYAYLARFAGIPLVGTAWNLTKKRESALEKILSMAWFFSLGFGLLIVDSRLYGTVHSYANLNTYIAAGAIIAGCWLLGRLLPKVMEKLIPALRFVTEISMAFYLTHVHFGFITMHFLRMKDTPPCICYGAAWIISFLTAAILTKAVKRITSSRWYKGMDKIWMI